MATESIRVLIVEDHCMVREGLSALLGQSSGLEVVGEASDGESGVERAMELGVDVVVLDIGLPKLSGIEAATRIRAKCPDTQIVILSMHDDAATVDRALRAGARGYVLKGQGIGSLVEAIRAVHRGDAYLSSGVSEYVLERVLEGRTSTEMSLTERETQVVSLVAEGLTSGEVAERLGLKPKTVQNHRTNAMDKLGLRTTAGLVRYALRTGLAK